jgi:hypothetical protein
MRGEDSEALAEGGAPSEAQPVNPAIPTQSKTNDIFTTLN